MKRYVDLMLDSGAFNMWSRGAEVDMKSYIKFVHDNIDYFYSYVTLDSIPSTKKKRDDSQATFAESAKRSYAQLKQLHRAGLKPIPVFHQGEPFYWLERLVAEGEHYIGLARYRYASKAAQQDWLDKCFTILTDENGRPLIKTHGFAITTHEKLRRYPWFSVDSTTWTMQPSYGGVPVPVYRGGKPDFMSKVLTITISDRPDRQQQKYHYDRLGPTEQQMVEKFLREMVGITILDARYDPNLRRRAFLIYYKELLKCDLCPRFQHRVNSMHPHMPKGLKPPKPWKLKLFYATSPWNGQYHQLMNGLDCNDRLLSYFDLSQGDPDRALKVMRSVVETGLSPDYKGNETPKTDPRSWNETYTIMRIFRQAYQAGYQPHAHSRFVPFLLPKDEEGIDRGPQWDY